MSDSKPRYFIGAALYALVPVLVIGYFAHNFASERDRLESELAQCLTPPAKSAAQ